MPEIAIDDRKNPRSLDLELLLNQPFICNVEVKITEKGEGDEKKTYKNVNFKGSSPVPNVPVLDAEGEETGEEKPMKVPALQCEPVAIQFSTATVEQLRKAKLRSNIIKIIKLANNYAGSPMQAAVEAYEAELEAAREAAGEEKQEEEKPAKPAPAVKKAPKKLETPKPEATNFDDMDDDIPF
jgi:hypothetical protein